MKNFIFLISMSIGLCSFAQRDTIFFFGFENVGPITNTGPAATTPNGRTLINGMPNNLVYGTYRASIDFRSAFTANGQGSVYCTPTQAIGGGGVNLFIDSIDLMGFRNYDQFYFSLNYFDRGNGRIDLNYNPDRTSGNNVRFLKLGLNSSTIGFQNATTKFDTVFANFTSQISQFAIVSILVSMNDTTSNIGLDDILFSAGITESTHFVEDFLSDTSSCKFGNSETFDFSVYYKNMQAYNGPIKVVSILKDEAGLLLSKDSITVVKQIEHMSEYTLSSPPIDLSSPGKYSLELVIKANTDTLAADDTLKQIIYNTSIAPGFVENFDTYLFLPTREILPNVSPYWNVKGNSIQQTKQFINRGSVHPNVGPNADYNTNSNRNQYAYINLNNTSLTFAEHQLSCLNSFIDTNRLLSLSYFYHAFESDRHALNHHVIQSNNGRSQELLFMHGDSIAAATEFPNKNAPWKEATTFFTADPQSILNFRGSRNLLGRSDHWFLDQLTVNYNDTLNLRVRHRSPLSERELCPDTANYQFDLVNTSSDTIDLSLNNYTIKSFVYRGLSIVDSFTTVVNSAQHGQYLLPYTDIKFSLAVDMTVPNNYTLKSFLVGHQDPFIHDDTAVYTISSLVIPGVALTLPVDCPNDSLGVGIAGSNKSYNWQVYDSSSMQWTDIPNTENMQFYRFESKISRSLRARVCQSTFTNVVQVTPFIENLFDSTQTQLSVNDTLVLLGDTSYHNIRWQVGGGPTIFADSLILDGLNYNLGQNIEVIQNVNDTINKCLISDTLYVLMVWPSSLDERRANDAQYIIYPNPAKQNFTLLQAKANDAEIWISDAKGTLKRQYRISAQKSILNLDGLSQGLYFVSIITDEGRLTKKLMVVE